MEAGARVPEHLAVELPAGAAAAAAATGSAALGTVLERSRRLCLLSYAKEPWAPSAFMGTFSKLGLTFTDEQLSTFAGARAERS